MAKRLDPAQRERAIRALKLAATLQFTVYGVPSIYYGDEAGLEGYRDPFCRLPYPWGREERELVEHYRALGRLREDNREVLGEGEFSVLHAKGGLIVYRRESESGEICVIANAGGRAAGYELEGEWLDLLCGERYSGKIAPQSAKILRRQ